MIVVVVITAKIKTENIQKDIAFPRDLNEVA